MMSTSQPPRFRMFRLSRFTVETRTSAGQGFGKKAPQRQGNRQDRHENMVLADTQDAVQKALRLAESKPRRPVRKEEAASGRIDYAKVREWGGGGSKQDLGSLQIKSFVQGESAKQSSKGLYVVLTLAVVRAKEQGLIDEYLYRHFPTPGRQNLPEFAAWSLREERYLQYLIDQHAVHHALEGGMAEAIAVIEEPSSITAAMECFSESKGLNRSLEIAADLNNIEASRGARSDSTAVVTQAAAEYVQYLQHLGNAAVEAPSIKERTHACLQLVAHIYSNHLQHFTSGSRIGAATADKLNLRKRHAVKFYQNYPFHRIGKDPLKAFQSNVNSAGNFLRTEEVQIIVDELPCATAHVMQLVETLAFVD